VAGLAALAGWARRIAPGRRERVAWQRGTVTGHARAALLERPRRLLTARVRALAQHDIQLPVEVAGRHWRRRRRMAVGADQ
jgi:hypothetical protein